MTPLAEPPARGHVHVWAIPCADPPLPLERLEAALDPGERARVARFRFAEDRVRAVIGRGGARVLLGGCLGRRAEALLLGEVGRGKPVLDAGSGPDLQFNVSHSGDWVLIGITSGEPIGVDVERHRELSDLEALMDRFFAPAETRAIRSLPAEQRTLAFFECWTRKEAFLKATGEGIAMGLDRFEVEARPGHPPALRAIDGSRAAAAAWRMWSRAPDEAHSAAVVTGAAGPVHAAFWSGRGLEPWNE